MAIQDASANLSSEFTISPFTGFYKWELGELDSTTNTIKATGNSTWGSLSTWADFTNYVQTFKQIRWTSNLIDVGEIKYFTMKIEAEYTGSLFYIIHVSETGDFVGEEDQFIIENGNYAISAFYGRYAYVTAVVDGSELSKLTITTNSTTTTRTFTDVDTSTLTGTSSQRTYEPPLPVSRIVDCHIQPKEPTAYAVDLYVSNTPTSQVLIPMVISKSTAGVDFALYGIDNVARDGVVDITMKTLPRQAMIGGNIVVID